MENEQNIQSDREFAGKRRCEKMREKNREIFSGVSELNLEPKIDFTSTERIINNF